MLDALDGAHEPEAPVGRDNGHEMEHERREDRVHAIFNEEGDFGGVVWRGRGLVVVEGDFWGRGKGGDRGDRGAEEDHAEEAVDTLLV